MAVLRKLMEARIILQNKQLKKTGQNKFAGYFYFELGDFLPVSLQIFNDLKLSSYISYFPDVAVMTITDDEDGTFININTPMAAAALKGAHDIQNLGAVQTYLRRYLWVTAMEIVEHDALDATTGNAEPVKPKPVIPKTEPVATPVKTVPKAETKPITGEKGEWQIVATHPPEGDATDWLKLIHDSAMILLDLTANEEDVMQIFKKNKSLFDTVKATDAVFFKAMMAKFTERNNMFKQG